MTEEELFIKNERTRKIKSVLGVWFKFIYLFILTWAAISMTWNLFIVNTLGIGRVVVNEDLWKFGLPTLGLFITLRAITPNWLKLIDFWSIVICSVTYFGFLWFLK